MEPNTMLKINVDGIEREYPRGTTYAQIAAGVQHAYPYDILLADVNNRLRELTMSPDRDCEVKFLTATDRQAKRAYERGLTFLMVNAIAEIVGPRRDPGERIVTVQFSLSNSVFCTVADDITLNDELLRRAEAAMRRMIAEDIPLTRSTIATDDAIALFERQNMHAKAELMRFRLAETVNTYSLNGVSDYFYGPMVPSTGYLKYFSLELFESGFVLRLPTQEEPDRVGPFTPSRKVFEEMYNTALLGDKLGLYGVAAINRAIAAGKGSQMILASEALTETKIGNIARQIAARGGVRFVMIAGPSSSGKTTFSHRLSSQLIANGLRPHPIATDNYFVNRADTPLDANGEPDYEGLAAMDTKQFNEDMSRLLKGERVEMPHYNFKKGCREYNGDFMQLGESDVLVIEGIHCLNDEFSYALPAESKFRIYISCLTTLNVDALNRIPTTDARLLRRIARDARTRGYSASDTIRSWPKVRRGEESNIFPHQDSADVVVNSAQIYETCLLKPYVEPLLYSIPRDCPEWIEADRLLRFLGYFMPIPADIVPLNSIVREFAGGGCYQV